jgi:rhomboid protease GluP
LFQARCHDLLVAAMYAIGLFGALAAGTLALRGPDVERPGTWWSSVFPLPRTTLWLLTLVAVPTALQFVVPGLLPAFERNARLVGAGEWWRLLTALVVQDGGAPDATFNVLTLALVGSVAERRLGRARLVVLFLAGGIAAEVIALWWQPVGAGNSVANFSVAGGLSVAAFTGEAPKASRPPAVLSLVACGVLAALLDIHGAAALAGGILQWSSPGK